MQNKDAARQFLEWVTAGRIDEAYERFVDMQGRHHNAYFGAGFPALRQAMKENEAQFPGKAFSIKHLLAEGDFVAAHSHVVLKPGELELATCHLFRFQGGKIAELWDLGQQLPAKFPNQDGPF